MRSDLLADLGVTLLMRINYWRLLKAVPRTITDIVIGYPLPLHGDLSHRRENVNVIS